MPQIVKGGKWVFGWVVVGRQGVIRLPPAAQQEYGFRAGERLAILAGSRRSGGFALGKPLQLISAFGPKGSAERKIGETTQGEDGCVVLPPAMHMQAGSRLLVVRGSGRALGFIGRGPIYEEALRHNELETFDTATMSDS